MKLFFIFYAIIMCSNLIFPQESISFQDRVKYQYFIEKIYYDNRIWPSKISSKPEFEKVAKKGVIEKIVKDYLKKSVALEMLRGKEITAEELKQEMERIIKNSKDKKTLLKIFSTLNNDPFLIAEIVARKTLVERLAGKYYYWNKEIHNDLRNKAQEIFIGINPLNFAQRDFGKYLKIKIRKDLRQIKSHNSGEIILNYQEFSKVYKETPEEKNISNLIEKEESFAIYHTLKKEDSLVELECLIFPKKPFESWLEEQSFDLNIKQTSKESYYSFSVERESMFNLRGSCSDGWWENSSLDQIPDGRYYHTAIWTGNEMIIWGGQNGSWIGNDIFFNNGYKYNPTTDTWSSINQENAPVGRKYHTAIWTGSKMIIWGGVDSQNNMLNTGGIYDPTSDSWQPTSTGDNVPSPRVYHTAIWDENEMIIWGGGNWEGTFFNNGGRYNPNNNTWAPISTTGAPSERWKHSAIWTGSEMIVWGGFGYEGYYVTGGKYDPDTDTWQATNIIDAPSEREEHTAIWTGSVMVVWGGVRYSDKYNTGGRYNPFSDTWQSTSTTDAPVARNYHIAIWDSVNQNMIIWGGSGYGDNFLGDGAKYSPSNDQWQAISNLNAPVPRWWHTAVWTGSQMIIWGGYSELAEALNDGAKYNPDSDSWNNINIGEANPTRNFHTAVWTGNEMIIWGGQGHLGYMNSGKKYIPSLDSWVDITLSNAPEGRIYHEALWTGSVMIVWGGYGTSGYLNSGGRYNPLSDSWQETSTTSAPVGRESFTAVWDDLNQQMIIWGGYNPNNGFLNTGGRYSPEQDNWSNTSTGENVPSARSYHTAIWDGQEMIIWGGGNEQGHTNTGAKYDAGNDTWTPISTTNAPSARTAHTAVWSGQEMIIWGGGDEYGNYFNSGGKYDPAADSWSSTSQTGNVPSPRVNHKAVWTGEVMVIWGGEGGEYFPKNDGGRYHPGLDTWYPLLPNPKNSILERIYFSMVWADNFLIIFGGIAGDFLSSGGIYWLPFSPSAFSVSTEDLNGCNDEGVRIAWTAPLNWGDNGDGTRTFDVLRNGTPIATGLTESTLSYIDTTGENGISYNYSIRANNGCGYQTQSASSTGADNVTPPEVGPGNGPSNALIFSGKTLTWPSAGENLVYKLYRITKPYLPNLQNSNHDGCLRYQGSSTSYDCSSEDPSGEEGKIYYYLVTAVQGTCEGSAGSGRNLSSYGNCP